MLSAVKHAVKANPHTFAWARLVDSCLRLATRRPLEAFALERGRYQVALTVLSAAVKRHGMAPGYMTPDGEFYIRTSDGIHLFYNFSNPLLPPGDGQSLDVLAQQTPNQPLEDWLIRQVPQDGIYIDVGANNGYYYTLRVARKREHCDVFAFEPDPGIRVHLQKNVTANDAAARVQVIPVALTNYSGNARLTANTGAMGFLVSAQDTSSGVTDVRCQTLDSFIDDHRLPRISAIKIDIEGGELKFLHGAAGSLKRFQPALLLELNDQLLARDGAGTRDVVEFLSAAGYQLWRVAGSHDAIAVHSDSQALELSAANWIASPLSPR